ncbi:MAG: hypothetical protein J2O46_08105 [Nocardioides sp.]|nr:hypothetical protein [Nocardioides sp.]
MSAKTARRVGAVAGIALIPTMVFAASANAAEPQAGASHAGAHQKITAKGTITAVKQKQGKHAKAEKITVAESGNKTATFTVRPKAKVVKGGHRVSPTTLAKGEKVVVKAVKAKHGKAEIAKRIKIAG